MDTDVRPAKMRKLSHSGNPEQDDVAQNLLLSTPGAENYEIAEVDVSQRMNDVNGNESETSAIANGSLESGQANVSEAVPSPAATDIAPLANFVDQPTTDKPLSKNQKKKILKKLEWESKREDRKVIRKEKLIAKRERKRAAKLASQTEESTPAIRESMSQRAVQLPVTIIIDCDFDDLMRDNERISLASQVTRSYSDNKNSLFRAHLAVCSFDKKLKERFDTVLRKNYKSWRGVRFLGSDFVETGEMAKEWMATDADSTLKGAFDRHSDADVRNLKQQGEVVYLSSEADETLHELKPYSTYIIGGLVDKNREKGICHRRATQRGVKTARLPIGDFMEMQSRKVLATNHVSEIMIKWLECGDWGEAFMKVIPKRKGGKLKGGEIVKDEAEEDDDESQVQDFETSDIAKAGISTPEVSIIAGEQTDDVPNTAQTTGSNDNVAAADTSSQP